MTSNIGDYPLYVVSSKEVRDQRIAMSAVHRILAVTTVAAQRQVRPTKRLTPEARDGGLGVSLPSFQPEDFCAVAKSADGRPLSNPVL
jgi:hypothetical protein